MSGRSNQDTRTGKQRRLSAALRENLKRRKAQARARFTGEAPARKNVSHDSAGITEDERADATVAKVNNVR